MRSTGARSLTGWKVELTWPRSRIGPSEQVIRDLKEESGWNHAPSESFAANAAWWSIGAMAHNLARWTARLGGLGDRIITTPKLCQRFIAIPGHITHSGRRTRLHLVQSWPWAEAFMTALDKIRAVGVLVT